jgi:hypothetical protein
MEHEEFDWGATGDIPLIGRFFHDTRAQLVVFRPSTGAWWIKDPLDSGNDVVLSWGTTDDVPFVGNFSMNRPGKRQPRGDRNLSAGQWAVLDRNPRGPAELFRSLPPERPATALYKSEIFKACCTIRSRGLRTEAGSSSIRNRPRALSRSASERCTMFPWSENTFPAPLVCDWGYGGPAPRNSSFAMRFPVAAARHRSA